MTILDEIIEHIRSDLDEARHRYPLSCLKEQAERRDAPRGFESALRPRPDRPPRVIAELKKASPSRGLIRPRFGAVSLARQLAANGAAALSVLTEVRYFKGSSEYLQAARANVDIPVLRKDFIVDPYQVVEARAWGADAILLIAAALSAGQFADLHAQAKSLGLDVLAEVHTESELASVLDAGATTVGINSRDLRTFTVDLAPTERLLAEVPPSCVRVAESGVRTAEDIERLRKAGADAFLVGETLMRAAAPGDALADLLRPATQPLEV